MDAVERVLTRCLQHSLGPTDIFFRYQINQYVINVQRRTDRNDADKLTRRITQAIEDLDRELGAENGFAASVVLTRMPEDGESLQDLVMRLAGVALKYKSATAINVSPSRQNRFIESPCNRISFSSNRRCAQAISREPYPFSTAAPTSLRSFCRSVRFRCT